MLRPILISIAHSSIYVPKEIKERMFLSDFDIKKMSDLYTDEIFDIKNYYKVEAHISRLVCDPNRAPDDIQSESELCSEGVVVRVNEDGKQVYKEPPTPEMIMKRIETYHKAFHDEIDNNINKVKFMIDGHSMCSIGPYAKADRGKDRPDICLGNRLYSSCNFEFTRFWQEAFTDLGYSVSINKPYSGHFVLGYHCHRQRIPGIQIEINRKLFMNEETLEPNNNQIKLLNKQIGE